MLFSLCALYMYTVCSIILPTVGHSQYLIVLAVLEYHYITVIHYILLHYIIHLILLNNSSHWKHGLALNAYLMIVYMLHS